MRGGRENCSIVSNFIASCTLGKSYTKTFYDCEGNGTETDSVLQMGNKPKKIKVNEAVIIQ